MIRRWLARRRTARLDRFFAVLDRFDWEREHFATVVMPARIADIAAELNFRLADVLPEGMSFEWVSAGQDGDGQ